MGRGKMDWQACIRQRLVKGVKKDEHIITAIRAIADAKIRSAAALPDEFFIGKITLLYDALREILESIALGNGFKVYNHECYAAFLKEIMKCSREADAFDSLRKIRNGINYYGKAIRDDEANQVIADLQALIKKMREGN